MAKRSAIIYIDGENFLHRIEDTLKRRKLINKKEQILHFAVRELFSQIIEEFNVVEIRYYGTKIRTHGINDSSILAKAQGMIESQRRFKRDLLNQNIEFIVAGALRVREVSCHQCKKTSLVFKEKGVDVRMAVDIAIESSSSTDQIVVSSDSDLLPALKRAKQNKSRLVYVHHAEQPNYAMIKASDETRVFTANQIVNSYKLANSLKGRK